MLLNNNSSPKLRQGFALPAVLAVTGVVTLVFLVAITALASMTAEAQSARDRVRFLERAMSAEANIAYMLSMEPLRSNGRLINGSRDWSGNDESSFESSPDNGTTNLIRLDGRPYLMDVQGPLKLHLQDQAGLINLPQLRGITLERFLQEIGLDADKRMHTEARFIDYMDLDDMRQVNGAEREEYGARGLANRPLRRPSEFLSILGLRQGVDRHAWNRIRAQLAADHTQITFNVNTASPVALKVVLDLNPSQIETLIQERERAPIASTATIDTLVGSQLLWDPEFFYTVPSNVTLFTLHDTRSAWIYRARLSLTPASFEKPVWIDQLEMTEAPLRAKANTTDAIKLPYTPY